MLSAPKFPVGAVKRARKIELWSQERGLRFKDLPDGEHDELPLAHASTRAMGTCLSLDETAGGEAARSVRS